MKICLTLPLLLLTLLLAGCASNPAQESTTQSKTESLQKIQEIQVEKQQQAKVETPVKTSIVPDINAKGYRGDIARKILAKSTDLFLKADMNQDNLISVEEAGQHLPHVSKDFSRYDKNKDDGISWQELLGHDKWPAPVH